MVPVQPMDLAGRVAVVTGGGRGSGAAIARSLAAAGAHVVVSGRHEETLAAVVGEIRAAGGRADAASCDVTRPDEVARLLGRVHEVAGLATIVVNNAGIARSAKLIDTDEDTWREVIDTNLTGAYRVTRAFHTDVVAAARRGRFIYIGSTASKVGLRYTSAYTAAKHGVLGLSRTLALELAGKGPTVNCVCPGWVDTEMVDEAVAGIVAHTRRTAEAARQELERMSPQQRLMSPEEVAAVVRFLAGDAAAGITGQAWNIDGGQVMH